MNLRKIALVSLLLLLPLACSDETSSEVNNASADAGTDLQDDAAAPVCNDDDGECADGCNVSVDNDCEVDCGNGFVDIGETCDGNCPRTCADFDACTTEVATGSAGLCSAACEITVIETCTNGDGCCPATCSAANDTDCDAMGLGPARVELGSKTDLATPGAYALLAKTGITNVTGSSITGGHAGLSPAAATFVTGFSLIAHSTNVYSTSVSVVAPGKLYASDYAVPTPSNLTTAVLGMEAAYSDAAGRSNPDFLNLASGNLGGLTLAPGLYNWGSGVTIPEDVTIAGGSNDVWIFQITDDLDQSAAKKIILSGGAQAKNIFWQVAGQVTIHSGAHFEGVILCSTGITLQTDASMNGRALSQTLIALDDNNITAP